MTTNTAVAGFIYPKLSEGGVGFGYPSSGLDPETPPAIFWGQGTPDGDRAPFNVVNKGSMYIQMDATDDESHVWTKVDEGGDDADWVRVFVDGHALIANADIAANAAIAGSKLATNARIHFAKSKVFNIDNGSGTTDDDVILVPDRAITIVGARAVYVEATDTAGAASANVKIGTAAGGAQIVAETALQVSKAVGAVTALTLATGAGAIAANGGIFVRHTGIAATEAGQYYVQIAYTVDD